MPNKRHIDLEREQQNLQHLRFSSQLNLEDWSLSNGDGGYNDDDDDIYGGVGGGDGGGNDDADSQRNSRFPQWSDFQHTQIYRKLKIIIWFSLKFLSFVLRQ